MTKAIENSQEIKQKLLDSLLSPIIHTLDAHGITKDKLAKLLKKELSATETKTYNDKGQVIYSEPLIAWEIRQRARQDAHKLRGDYPAEKHQIDTDLTIEIINYADSDKKAKP